MKNEIITYIENKKELFTHISDEIWKKPELAYQEFFASKLQADFLASQGFTIHWDVGGLNTAFYAEWGSGKPVIGFIGEYDALEGLSQKVLTKREPLTEGGAGHGCGHNLLGVGALTAACALKEVLQKTNISACIRYYGCPAEEFGSGKTFMARAGAFDDIDVAFNFHPFNVNFACKGSAVGVREVKFRFSGKTAHAGATPHLGRSALDAVELMNIGVNYLREHITSDVRIHYVITKGGDVPNIVPDDAEVWYFIRAHLPQTLQNVYSRVEKIASAACMMTETEVKITLLAAMANVLNNKTLAELQYQNMQLIGKIPFTQEEMNFAEEINRAYSQESVEGIAGSFHLPKTVLSSTPLVAENYPSFDDGIAYTFSTDVGDLSWKTPLSLLFTTCFPSHVSWHTWGVVASGGMSIGHKGMLHAAKIMACTALDVIVNPKLLADVRLEFTQALETHPHPMPLPEHVQPLQYLNPFR